MDLVLPVKTLALAKSRLRGSRPHSAEHAELALAFALDTLAAARAAAGVRRVLVVSSDPLVAAALGGDGVDVVPDAPDGRGLNDAYAHGAGILRLRDPDAAVGALQADLPALRPEELAAAVARFAELGAVRAYHPDADGTGTTLLLAAPGAPLDPRFGAGSAARHALSGAVRLDGVWPGLRHDVDTEEDLRAAAQLGLGEHTAARSAARAGQHGRPPRVRVGDHGGQVPGGVPAQSPGGGGHGRGRER